MGPENDIVDEPTQLDTLRRSWGQRLLIGGSFVAAGATFLIAGLVWIAQQGLEDRLLVALDEEPVSQFQPADPATPDAPSEPEADTGGDVVTLTSDPNVPVETFPQAEPGARNILITGADNNACLDPDSRFAPAFGDRDGLGERSDTIMMWRVNPATSQVAVLSFPRDLWVNIDGRSSKARINTAYERDDPQRLINTIRQNFGIETDHFIQVDFCAFKELVDAVGGVAVPFATPVRDGATGLIVPEAGCFTFTGEHALAYVRSRKIEAQGPDGLWNRDGTSDLGRISRQQDFIRRVGDQLLANAFSPSVVRTLFSVSEQYILTDTELTLDKILGFSGVLRNSNPADITTYQIEASGTTIQGNAVLEPRLGGSNMQAILSLFRGEVTLADRPEQVFETDDDSATPATTVPVIDPDDPTTVPETSTTTTTEPVPFEPIPEIEIRENALGEVIPDGSISCA